MADIVAVRILKTMKEARWDRYIELLTPQKQAKIRRFLKQEDMQRSLVAEILLRVIIFEKLKIQNNEIGLAKNKYGKPYLKGNSGFHFNISHSGEWVVCATDECEVGIDVEEVKLIQTDNIVQNFFSEEECSYFKGKGDSQKLDLFYNMWTLKESFIKALGTGFSMDFKQFTILFGDPIRVRSHRLESWFLKLYEIDSGYRLSLCTKHMNVPSAITYLSLEDLREKAETYFL